jgi:outer membrane immunogenic protein
MRSIALVPTCAGLALLFGALAAAPALAQDDPAPQPPAAEAPASTPAITPYASLGYSAMTSGAGLNNADIGIFSGRVGARFGRYWGVEAEAGVGTNSDTDDAIKSVLKHEYAGYLVGWLPIGRKLNLFARAGVGTSRFQFSHAGATLKDTAESLNWGVGAEYAVTEKDGVRIEYLQQDFTDAHGVTNRVTVSVVRKF